MDGTVVVVGASRGLGRGIALAFADARREVVAVARTSSAIAELAEESPHITAHQGDATDADLASGLIATHRPAVLVLVAGASPPCRPLQDLTWDAFSVNWQTDVKVAFVWLQAVLANPLLPGSRVIVVSSGAALAGSPLSGGYAGAKATQQFITGYAAEESKRADLGIAFTAVLPRLTPLTELGQPAVAAYAARYGQSEEEYLAGLGEPLSPMGAGAAALELAIVDVANLAPAYLLTGAGLQPL